MRIPPSPPNIDPFFQQLSWHSGFSACNGVEFAPRFSPRSPSEMAHFGYVGVQGPLSARADQRRPPALRPQAEALLLTEAGPASGSPRSAQHQLFQFVSIEPAIAASLDTLTRVGIGPKRRRGRNCLAELSTGQVSPSPGLGPGSGRSRMRSCSTTAKKPVQSSRLVSADTANALSVVGSVH